MNIKRTRFAMFMIALLALSTFSIFSPLLPTHAQPDEEVFAFVVISDPRPSFYRTGFEDFEDDLQQIKYWIDNPTSDMPAPRFMEVTGDFDHSTDTEVSIDTVLGTDFIWFPTIGNHELDEIADFEYCRDTIFPTLPWIVDTGPAGSIGTSYSWDYGNAHFVSVNCYWDGTTVSGADHATARSELARGDIPAELCDWVEADLAASGKTHKFVFVHEPAFPEVRHVGDALDMYPANRDAFVTMLDDMGVEVLFVGHTHYYHHDTSSEYPLLGDVHQVSSGQIGHGSSLDGSTIIYVLVNGDSANYKVYRSTTHYPFTLYDEWTLPVRAIVTQYIEPIPTIDGSWSSKVEWVNASETSVQEGSLTAFIRTKQLGAYIYVLIEIPSDRQPEESDEVYLGFAGSQAGDEPSRSAFLVNVRMSGKILKLYQGSFGGWVPMDPPSDLRVEAGYAWGGGFSPYESGRHATYELSIPTSILSPSGSYGFFVSARDGKQNVTWPQGAVKDSLNTWGKLTGLLYPNLVVVDAWVGDEVGRRIFPEPDTPFHVWALIGNMGNASTKYLKFDVDLFLDDLPLKQFTSLNLMPGIVMNVSYMMGGVEEGTHTVRWIVNSAKLPETDFSNNELDREFTVTDENVIEVKAYVMEPKLEIKNPGFESGSLEGWESWHEGKVEVQSDVKMEGVYAVEVEPPLGGTKTVVQRFFPCSPGEVLKVKAMTKADEHITEGRIGFHWRTADKQPLTQVRGARASQVGQSIEASYDWSEFAFQAIVPESVSFFDIIFWFKSQSEVSGHGYIDNVRLEKMSSGLDIEVKVDDVAYKTAHLGYVQIQVSKGIHKVEVQQYIPLQHGVRYFFKEWDDGEKMNPRHLVADEMAVIEALYLMQYFLFVNKCGGEVYGEGWYDEGAEAVITVEPIFEIEENRSRLVFQGWSGNYTTSGEMSITMDASYTFSANWLRQYYLTVNSSLGNWWYGGWHDEGEYVLLTVDEISESEMQGTNIIVDDGQTEFWEPYGYGVILYDNATVKLSGLDSLDVFLEADGHLYRFAYHKFPQYQDWSSKAFLSFYFHGMNSGKVFTLTIDTQGITGDDKLRYIWVDNSSEWRLVILDLHHPSSSKGIPDLSKVNQLQLFISDDSYGGRWFFDEWTLISLVQFPPPPAPYFGKPIFHGWSNGLNASSKTIEIRMEGPMAITANWKVDYIGLYAALGFIMLTLTMVGVSYQLKPNLYLDWLSYAKKHSATVLSFFLSLGLITWLCFLAISRGYWLSLLFLFTSFGFISAALRFYRKNVEENPFSTLIGVALILLFGSAILIDIYVKYAYTLTIFSFFMLVGGCLGQAIQAFKKDRKKT